MQREIYEVTAKIVDSTGAYNTLSGYPKVFDSKHYDNDLDKTWRRATGEWHAAMTAMSVRDDRPLQLAMITRMSDGVQIIVDRYGDMPELPDPEPEPTPEPEGE